jgi:hypothetical protein
MLPLSISLLQEITLGKGQLFLAAARSPLVDLLLGLLDTRGDRLGSLVLGVNGSFLGFLSSLLDVFLRRRLGTGTSQENDDGDDEGHDTTDTASNLGHELDGLDGIFLGESEEQLELLGDVLDWVILEDEVVGRLGDIRWLRLGLGLLFLLNRTLHGPGLFAESLRILLRVANVDVVEENIGLHGPDLETDGAHGLEVGRSLILVEIRVGDHAGRPDTLVSWVVDVLSGPLALVRRVLLHRGLPRTTSRGFLALGVRNLRWDPIAIFFVIPILRLLGLGVRNCGWLVVQPVGGLLGLIIDNLERRILIPVFRLGSLRVRNASLIDPVFRLLVVGIADLGGWVDRRGEIFEKGAILGRLVVDEHLEGVIGTNDKSIEGRELRDLGGRSALEVFLLVLAGLGVLVVKDEVDLLKSEWSTDSQPGLHTLLVAPHLSGPNMIT